jgi:hypothetical protein
VGSLVTTGAEASDGLATDCALAITALLSSADHVTLGCTGTGPGVAEAG